MLRPVPRWSTKTTGDGIAEGNERRCKDRGVRLGRGARSARDVEDGSSGTFDVVADDGSVQLDVGAGLATHRHGGGHCTASDGFAINKA